MLPDDARNNPEKVIYLIHSSKSKPKPKVGYYIGNTDKRISFSEG